MTVPRLRHLLSIDDLDRPLAERILETARAFEEVGRRPVKKVPTLRGKTIVNLFYEASTRTRTSFELAGKRLSADVVNIGGSSSSVSKGETLSDTVRTIDAMHPDVIVVRHPASGAAQYVAARTRAAIVNAGDGLHQHPTQALLDAFTILAHKGKLEGLTVAICGDILHSRVARSNARLLPMLGATVRLAGPSTLLPRDAETLGCAVYERLEPALEGAYVVMMLRIQRERLGGAFFPTLREYSRVYGLNRKRLALARPQAIVMHPGPLNRGVEISDDVADGEHSVILDQVESGVAVRMAVLYMSANEPEALPLAAG
ncbi:MAG TPA: aspartate carbamoyltransferase catalytic subunit [Polyangiaceae bacterium]|nr:aspartate carbamoyltransferase catalytic subunit [Polyangiaceae bacterium]